MGKLDVKGLKSGKETYLHSSAAQEEKSLSPDSSQQEERSTYEIWAPPGNNMRVKRKNGE